MTVYVDTSALYAYLVADDPEHTAAVAAFELLRADDRRLHTTSFVLVETIALLQARVGLAAVRTFHDDLRPLLDVTFVDDDLHEAGITALLAAGRRRLSLVDWVSFTDMRRRGIVEAFAFDDDFAEQGFTLVPPAA